MPPRGRRIKPEPSTILGDYPTPGESIRSARTVTPKREIPEIDLTSDDDTPPPPTSPQPMMSFKSQTTEDEGYASRAANLQHRSPVSRPIPQPPAFSPQRTNRSAMAPAPPQGLEFVGSKVKILVDGISDLRKYGLQHVVELPELVLVGDQSAGKSSLMSALTEVKLPRDQGICTKCPANIKTSPAETWSCKISLQQEYEYNPTGRPITESTVTRNNPFPPWAEQELQVKEFLTTENKDDLEDGIKWAQLALLNHDTDYREFIPGIGARALGSFEHERENAAAKFSPNLISVEISGPGLPALSFYDLPGVFRSAPDRRDQYLVKVIENLAIKYIKRPNALIIWTLAMKTDPSNSETGNIITKCNALQRCIGVLTNPDHVAARHAEYEKVLQGISHTVEHGYFVTKQPGENSLLDGPNYHALAREEEEMFFDTNELWRGDWVEFRSRCGTTIIQKYLSQQLAKQIQASIPTLEAQIEQRKSVVEQQLLECPALPAADVRNIILSLLSEFSNDVKTVMNGDSIDITTTFQSDWSRLAGQFRDLVLHIKPTVTVSHDSDKILNVQDVIELSDDESESPMTPSRKRPAPDGQTMQSARKFARSNSSTPGPNTPIGHRVFTSPQLDNSMKRESGFMHPPPTPSIFRRPRSGDNPFLGTPFSEYACLGKKFINLEDIRTCITNHACPGLPGIASYKTHNEIILMAVENWKRPLDTFLNELFSRVRMEVQSILRKHLGKYEQTQLYRTAKKELDMYVDRFVAEQRSAVQDFFEMERHKSFTVNQASVAEHREKEYLKLKAARRSVRVKALVLHEQQIDARKRFPVDISKEEKNRLMQKRISEFKDDRLGADSFDDELQVAAYVRAYYLTAGIRFVDNVCLSIHSKLFRNIRSTIFRYLEQKLDIDNATDGDKICRALMEEDVRTGQIRRDLQLELEKLNGFSQRLADLVEQINSPEPEGMPSSEHNDSFLSHNRRFPGDLDQPMRDAGGNNDEMTISGSPNKNSTMATSSLSSLDEGDF